MDDRPLIDRLRALAPGPLPMHMPGHKRRAALAPYLAALGAGMDITEIEGFDNLHDPRGILSGLMDRAARLYGARASFPLVNGSTAGILAGVRALSRPGDEVLLQRASHLSVYNALALGDLRPVYLEQPTLAGPGVPGSLSPGTLQRALDAHPGARLLILTCPSYEGVLSDLNALVALAKAAGLKVLIDAAHGAHLGFHPRFAAGAVASGADIVVHSLHKTLPSLTQTALAHAADEAGAGALAEALDMFQTTSPSYLLLASIDGCIRLLEEEGPALFGRWAAALDAFLEEAHDLRRLRLFQGSDPGAWGFDRTKLLIDCSAAGITGTRLMARLRAEQGIELEAAAARQALAMTGMGDSAEDLGRLARALKALDGSLAGAEPPPLRPLPQARTALPPGQALRLPWELVTLDQAAGRVCAELVCVYPPGVPLLAPGEIISGEILGALIGAETLRTRSKRAPGRVAVLCPQKMDSL